MQITKLLNAINGFEIINENFKLNITHLSCKSSEIQTGSLYFCLIGENFNGHDFANEVVNLGANCLVVSEFIKTDIPVMQIKVNNVRSTMSLMSKQFFGAFCDKVKIVSIVGTNGKTTTSYIISAILTQQNIKNAVIGTNGTSVGNIKINSALTTPDPIELHKLIKELHGLGVKVVILEASAHAIYLKKLDGIKSHIAILTNITHEHLDYFKTFENYKNIKLGFFNNENVENAIINIDDENAKNFVIAENDLSSVTTYGLYNPADCFAIDIKMSLKNNSFFANVYNNIMEINSSLIGVHNVYNLLSSIATALIFNCSIDNIVKALHEIKPIAGRMNIMNLDVNNKIIIDYAHSPDSFEQVLGLIKKLRQGKIVTVFGCVGYSLSDKRKEMGKIAQKYSDVIILTADNPNYVPLLQINNDIKSGFSNNFENFHEIENRAEAIYKGLSLLEKNDTLVILGKGIETYNLVMGKHVPHNDFDSVKDSIEKWFNVKNVKI